MSRRKVIAIDEELCTGCGKCVIPCVEGAIELVGGKARVKADALCDGAGFCLPLCPTGALRLEERETADFDPAKVEEAHRKAREAPSPVQAPPVTCFRCGASDRDQPLLPVRRNGESEWVCTRCLPSLIHG
ncbi:MAG TPA: ferredoxin [Firmicutes bacterium]|nr:ferredoxin [Bacillota bacterium]